MAANEFDFDVLCYGTISADDLNYVSHLPTPRRDSQVQVDFQRLGGEAATVARFLSTWGLRVAVVGNAIGQDSWGRYIRSQLDALPGVDTRYLVQGEQVRTPFCRILVTPDGERSILGYWFDEAPKTELLADMMLRARLLSVDVYGKEERVHAARLARSLGRPVVSADAVWPDISLARYSDLIVISRDFLNGYFPGVYIYDHALELQSTGAGAIIITHGQKPVLVVDPQGRPSYVEPFPVAVADTTGAGDVFKAAAIYGYLQQWDLVTVTRFACAASSLYIGQPRGQDRVPELAHISRLTGV